MGTSSRGSNLQAGSNVNLIATGAGKDSNILVQGSDITAGKDVTLIADNQVNLLASKDTSSDRSTNSSSSAAVGVAVTVGQGGASFGITASASKGKGHANSDDVVYSNSHVNAGNTVTIQSGGDTTLQGAVVSGKQVVADVGGNLNLQSLQDTSTFSGKQQNIGGSVTVGAGFSGSVSYSKSKVKGDFASVNEQTGIQAGDGGFQVNVKGNTDLKGAVIASNQTAIDSNRNSLTTGTLTHSDIENHSDYKASGVNLSGGISVAGSKPAGKPESSGGSTGNNGTNWSWHNPNKSGVNSAAAGISSDSGNERSTTHSGISAGAVTITDEAAQQQKTGQSASEAATSIQSNVLTGDGSNGLQKNWDGQKLLQEQAANAQIMATFGQQASKAVGDYAEAQMKIAEQLRSQGKDAEADAINALWGDNGSLRLAAHTVVGGLTGGIGGAAGAAAGTLTAPAVAQALREAGITGALADVLTAAASTAAGAVTGGVSGGAAAGNEVVNNYLNHDERRLLDDAKKACYGGGADSASACGTAAALAEKDRLSDKLLANAVATCREAECNDVSQFIQNQMAKLGCTIPSACPDQSTLQGYWRVSQSKAQGVETVYPESWALDEKAVLDLGKYGLKIIGSAAAKTEASASLDSLNKLSKVEIKSITSEGVANIATGAKLTDDLISKMAKPQVLDARLSGLMDDLYRDGAKIGSGSTADAVRYEATTGNQVGGKLHTQKAEDYSMALQKWLDANPSASFSDRSAAKNVLRDLQNALQGK